MSDNLEIVFMFLFLLLLSRRNWWSFEIGWNVYEYLWFFQLDICIVIAYLCIAQTPYKLYLVFDEFELNEPAAANLVGFSYFLTRSLSTWLIAYAVVVAFFSFPMRLEHFYRLFNLVNAYSVNEDNHKCKCQNDKYGFNSVARALARSHSLYLSLSSN